VPPRFYLTGVPGVGKSSTAHHPLIPEARLRAIEFGDTMVQVGLETGRLHGYADLQDIDLALRLELQSLAVEQILDHTRTMPAVITGHMLVDSPQGFVPGFLQDTMAHLNVSAIVVLVAEPEDIILRRRAFPEDKQARLDSNLRRISLFQRLTEAAAVHYALQYGCSVEILHNRQGRHDETVSSFLQLIRAQAPI
jgi:adenylate kinase